MPAPRPDRCVPWPRTLVALLLREGGTCEQTRFLRVVREYFGSHRWKNAVSTEEWDKLVHETLRESPGVVVEEDVEGVPTLPKFRPRDGQDPIFRGLRHHKWSVQAPMIVWRMRQRPDLSWMMPAIERQISPQDLVARLRPGCSKTTISRWAGVVQEWCDELGEHRPLVRHYRVHPHHKGEWALVRNLGGSVTALWLVTHDVIKWLNAHPGLARTFSVSRNSKVLGEQIAEAVERKLRLNACAKYIVLGTMTRANFKGWVQRTIINAIRDSGRQPTSRALLGALTDPERKSGLSRSDRQVGVDPDFLLAKIGDPSISPELIDAEQLRARVFEKLDTILQSGEDGDRYRRLFRAFYDEEDLDEVAVDLDLDPASIKNLILEMRGAIAPNRDLLLDLIGMDEYQPLAG